MYAYFRQMPVELEEAALVDGCTRWQALLEDRLAARRARDRLGGRVRVHLLVDRVPLRAGARPRRTRSRCPSSSPASSRASRATLRRGERAHDGLAGACAPARDPRPAAPRARPDARGGAGMNEQRYKQGMARPEIDIGARGPRAKPVVRADNTRDRRRRVHRRTPRARATRHGTQGRGPRHARLHPGGTVHRRRRRRLASPLEIASIGDQARVLDVFRTHRPDEVVHTGMILDPAYLATNRSTAFQVNVGGVVNLARGDDRLRRAPARQLLLDRCAPARALPADRRQPPDPARRRRPGHRLLRLDEGGGRGDALRLQPGARARLPHDPPLRRLRPRHEPVRRPDQGDGRERRARRAGALRVRRRAPARIHPRQRHRRARGRDARRARRRRPDLLRLDRRPAW